MTPDAADALIFDWDGTLVDSQAANHRALAAALRPYSIALPEPWFAARTGTSSAEMIGMLATELGRSGCVPVETIVAERDRLFIAQLEHVREYKAITDIARRYHGSKRLAVASGGSRRIIEMTMGRLGLTGLFELLVAREDVSAGKPAPDLFLLAGARLGVTPDRCLVYEDSAEGLLAARAAGMPAVDVRPVRQARIR